MRGQISCLGEGALDNITSVLLVTRKASVNLDIVAIKVAGNVVVDSHWDFISVLQRGQREYPKKKKKKEKGSKKKKKSNTGKPTGTVVKQLVLKAQRLDGVVAEGLALVNVVAIYSKLTLVLG
jgi:hypothetical protein